MNDRILELSFEAQRYALDNTTGPDLASLNELWQEKFAELIVRECIGIAYEYDAPKMSGPGMIIAGSIEQHFGVEK